MGGKDINRIDKMGRMGNAERRDWDNLLQPLRG
jgi:hypothetical protein